MVTYFRLRGIPPAILPALALAFRPIGRIAQVARSALVEEMEKPYILTARSKGLTERAVVLRHALRNAAIPTITVTGDETATFLNGAVVIETIFAWPGIGQLFIQAIQRRDLPLVEACVFVVALMTIALNLIVDLSYAAIDSRGPDPEMTTPGSLSWFEGKVALVTGSTTGIGEAVARRLSAVGPAWWSTRSPAGRRGSGWPPSWGTPTTSLRTSPTRRRPARLVGEAVARFGRLDILVNNAGITRRIPLDDLEAVTAAVWHEILDTNLVGAWNVTRCAVPHLRLSGQAAVVNLTSLVAHRFFGSSIPYAVSKAALAHLTQMLARVLGPEIRVNAVSPGFVATRWNEARPSGGPTSSRTPRAESGHARGDRRGRACSSAGPPSSPVSMCAWTAGWD